MTWIDDLIELTRSYRTFEKSWVDKYHSSLNRTYSGDPYSKQVPIMPDQKQPTFLGASLVSEKLDPDILGIQNYRTLCNTIQVDYTYSIPIRTDGPYLDKVQEILKSCGLIVRSPLNIDSQAILEDPQSRFGLIVRTISWDGNKSCATVAYNKEHTEYAIKFLEDTFSSVLDVVNVEKPVKVIQYYMAGGLHSQEVTLSKKEVGTIYPELYPDIDIELLAADYLSSNDSILILYGEPGSGKTTFLKYLMFMNPNISNVCYVKDVAVLASSEFWIKHAEQKHELTVLDDLDSDLTHSRASADGTTKGFLSNILSFSDGVLSGKKRPKVVITANQQIREVDSALVRPGRCFDVIHVDHLSVEQAKDLWINKFKLELSAFEDKFSGLKSISQATLMNEISRMGCDKVYRAYIRNGDKSYSIDKKLTELGIRVTASIEDKGNNMLFR